VELFVPYILENLDYAAVALFSAEEIEYPEAPFENSIYVVLGTREFRNWLVLRLTWADDMQGVHMHVQDLVKDIQEELKSE